MGVNLKEFPEGAFDKNYLTSSDDIKDVAKEFDSRGYFLEDITAVDFKEKFMLVYVFGHFKEHQTVSVRCFLDKENAVIDSISDIFGGALWKEREVYEFYGIEFKGHPNLIPLLLPADEDLGHPLLKGDKAKAVSEIYQSFKTGE